MAATCKSRDTLAGTLLIALGWLIRCVGLTTTRGQQPLSKLLWHRQQEPMAMDATDGRRPRPPAGPRGRPAAMLKTFEGGILILEEYPFILQVVATRRWGCCAIHSPLTLSDVIPTVG